MTTIACNRKEMAADSRFHEDGISFPCQKVFRIGGSLWGTAGETRGIGKFMRWLNDGQPDDKRPDFVGEMDEFYIIELNANGIFYWDKHLFPTEILLPHFAIGSGGDFARAYLDAGMTPQQAVDTVCERGLDYASAGPVQVERL